jgi:hypothetical protein
LRAALRAPYDKAPASESDIASEATRAKIGILGEFWAFMKVRKKWWLGLVVVMLALLGLLIAIIHGSAITTCYGSLF